MRHKMCTQAVRLDFTGYPQVTLWGVIYIKDSIYQ